MTTISTDREGRQTHLQMLLLVMVLMGCGIVMVYSASAALSGLKDSQLFLKRWGLRMLVGLLALYLVMRMDYRQWARAARALLALGFAGLLAVLALKLLGVGKVRGAYRWIPLPGGAFQPSDLMRLVLVVYLAESLSRRQGIIRNFARGYLPHIVIVGAAMGLIALQPDLGTALAIGLTCMLMLYTAGARLWHILGTGLALLPLLYTVIFVIGYRKDRVLAFLHPTGDAKGAGYQVAQSLLALGSGGVTGVGLGQSMQKHLFLPEPYTDFVFSIVGEELGLLGTLSLLALFLLFGRLGLRIARNAPDLHGFLLASGITCMVLVHALVNMGVSTGLLPATGLPLPFISYGGTSLILTLIATGILVNIGRYGASDPGAHPQGKAVWPARPFPRPGKPAGGRW